MADNQQELQRAFSLHQTGNLNKAADLYREIINRDANNYHALHYLGVIEAGLGNFEKAKSLMARSLTIQPQNIPFMENYATILCQTGDYNSAFKICQQGLRLSTTNQSLLYVAAISLFKLKRLQESLVHFDGLLSIQPNHIAAINERGTVLAEMKQYDAALVSVERALTFQPNNVEACLNKANLCALLKRYDEAAIAYDKALALKPNLPEAWIGRGSIFRQIKRYDEAENSYDKALAIEPDLAAAWLGRGNVLFDLKRYEESVAAYDKALALEPDLGRAWLGRGNVFSDLKRYDEALAAYDKALALEPDLGRAWLGRGNVFFDLRRYDEAIAAYDKALALEPDLGRAWLGRGNVYVDLKRYDEAIAAYDKALALEPDLGRAWLGRGNVYVDLKRYDEAVAAYDKALALEPILGSAWLGRGNVFFALKRYDEAVAAYDKALAFEPDLDGAEGMRLHAKMHVCDWENFEGEFTKLKSSLSGGKANIGPFSFLGVSSSSEDQLRCAKLWTAAENPPFKSALWRGERYKHDRIRIAYISSDFRPHPLSLLIVGFIESHNRESFEVAGISLQPEDASEIGQRMKHAFEKFIDVSRLSDDKIANLIREMEIDIAIDLNGYTRDGRPKIFAQRPAPVQISYMGFPATMGAEYIDYIIADRAVIPVENASWFSEKIMWLPNTYWATDQRLSIGSSIPSRAEAKLPEIAFVFCCFNQSYKIVPSTFNSWMRILKRVDRSVLWLLESNATAETNLRRETASRGVDPDRIIFAPRMPTPEHLARHRLADLFIDTLPYNAHTTASDSLWAGLPVLTQMGETFAGRVAPSLLTAIGLPELITTTAQAYEDLAVELATNAEKLAAIKNKLAENRLTWPLFNTQLFASHIEAAYMAVYDRYQAGLRPDNIYVPQQTSK